ncbi:MAG: FAD-dependent oxidoreductase [Planctomycetota bacterium]
MKRREFIRIVGGTIFCSAVAPGYLIGNSTVADDVQPGILIEAASFKELGGWKLDTQHYQQMGGNYLLAHGLGNPVSNAKTTVAIPESGNWQVYVRTRDWCPGDWESPGRFKVLVNGVELEAEFGSEGHEGSVWHWHQGGSVQLAAGEAEIQLQDLTGFDGRCDAIYLAREEEPELPGEDLAELAAWKDQLSGRANLDIGEHEFDVVIVGGGIAGCGAALAARSQGLSVALIQDRPVFGGNASQEIRVHTLGVHGKGGDILKSIDTPHYPNGSAEAIDAQAKRERTMAESGVSLFAGHQCIGLTKEGDRIVSVEAREVSSGVIKRFNSPVFIDATGDGWLGFWAGAEFRQGRESCEEFDESWDKHGELWSPQEPDMRVMGTSVLWNSTRTSEASTFPEVPWALPVANGHEAVNGEWYWEYSDNDLDQIDDAEQIRDHVLRAIFGAFSNAKQIPRNTPVALKWVSFVGGKRESRRLMGDYIYTMKDMTERREFDDTVVEEHREVDAHYQLKETGSGQDFLSKALFRNTNGTYYIPFRCFYSRSITNLMMAGRCFSCSHIGLCGPRVMNTCGQMGIATGYAAALCAKYAATPREVGQQHVSELRQLIGYE